MSKYTDDVAAAVGLINTYQISRQYNCPAIYFYTHHAHLPRSVDHRAEVSFLWNGEWWSKEIHVPRSGRLTESREAHLQAAIEWARKAGLGIEEWVPSGYRHTWIPKDVKERLTAEVKAWRKSEKERTA